MLQLHATEVINPTIGIVICLNDVHRIGIIGIGECQSEIDVAATSAFRKRHGQHIVAFAQQRFVSRRERSGGIVVVIPPREAPKRFPVQIEMWVLIITASQRHLPLRQSRHVVAGKSEVATD